MRLELETIHSLNGLCWIYRQVVVASMEKPQYKTLIGLTRTTIIFLLSTGGGGG